MGKHQRYPRQPTEPASQETQGPDEQALDLRIMRRQLPNQKPEYSASLSTHDEDRRAIEWMPLHSFLVELAMFERWKADAFERMKGAR